jgi:cell division protease FtsH
VSDETEVDIDREVKAILLQAQGQARGILEEHRDDLDHLAGILLEKETLEGKELLHLLKKEVGEPAGFRNEP